MSRPLVDEVEQLNIVPGKGKEEMEEESVNGATDAPLGAQLGERRLVVKKIWGHDDTGANGLEYLVEWETERAPAKGRWVCAKDLDADEMIDTYMTSFNMGRTGPPERWNQSCRANGDDYGCEHLRCRSCSWVRAMDRMGHDVTQWSKKKKKDAGVKEVEPEDSFRGSDVSQSRRQDAPLEQRAEGPPEQAEEPRRSRRQQNRSTKKVDFMV